MLWRGSRRWAGHAVPGPEGASPHPEPVASVALPTTSGRTGGHQCFGAGDVARSGQRRGPPSLQKPFTTSICPVSATAARMTCRKAKMKRLTAIAIVIFTSQAIAAFGGQPVTSATAPVTAPSGFFRANEFETGAFGTFASGVGSSANSNSHGWGGGLDVTHWLPWKYGGIRFQGTGTNTR
jgi:hypothetical protein